MARTMIIAEAGVNHNGRMDLAKRLVDAASTAGADFVKFQAFKSEHLVTSSLDKAHYQKKNGRPSESQYEMLKKLELSQDELTELFIYCSNKKIGFMVSAFDEESLRFILNMDVEYLKIPSGEITNISYLRIIGRKNKQVILSTGMSDINEIEMAVNVLHKSGLAKKNLTILHCNTEYPVPMIEVNLRAMVSIREAFGVEVGFSDHTEGIEIAIAAVALGATVIEKHITLDHNLPGPDHRASIEPKGLTQMINAIRNVEQAMGDGIKEPSVSEKKNLPMARKSLVAASPISVGELFSHSNIVAKRAGSGISPMRIDEIIGRKASRNFATDELIEI